jgi:hypothetical protein
VPEVQEIPRRDGFLKTFRVTHRFRRRGNFLGAFNIDSVSTDVNLGVLHTGDTLAYVYTLTAEGTTNGFEHGYDAFLGDPFGAEIVGDNLRTTVALAAAAEVPEPGTFGLILFEGVALLLWRKRIFRVKRPSLSD